MDVPNTRAPAGIRLLRGGPLLRLRSDEQLLALFRAGHDDAFRIIHDRYRQRLFTYARQMLGGSPSDAEDVMQDVFLRAYSALRADDRPISLRAWLYRVAHNRCIDHVRRPHPATVELQEETAPASLHDPIKEAQQREDLQRLVIDVGRLPEQQRSALLLREMEGLTYLELADSLDCSVPAVKSLLVRARMGLVEQAEARALSCADIRDDLDQAHDRGVRMTGRARRHLRDCAACRSYRDTLKGVSTGLHSLAPGPGPWTMLVKLFGIGSAGSGAAAGGAATVGGGGSVALIGGGAAATAGKVAAIVCCAAVVGGGAAEVQQRMVPTEPRQAAQTPRSKAPRMVAAVPAAVTARIHALDRSGPRPELAATTQHKASQDDDLASKHRALTDEALAPAPLPVPGQPDHGMLPGDPSQVEATGGLQAPDEPIAVPGPQTVGAGQGSAAPTTTGSAGTGTTPTSSGTTTGTSTGAPAATSPQKAPSGTTTATTPAQTPPPTTEPARDTGAPAGAEKPATGAGGAPTPGSSSSTGTSSPR